MLLFIGSFWSNDGCVLNLSSKDLHTRHRIRCMLLLKSNNNWKPPTTKHFTDSSPPSNVFQGNQSKIRFSSKHACHKKTVDIRCTCDPIDIANLVCLLLFLAGDVETNPGPGKLTTFVVLK